MKLVAMTICCADIYPDSGQVFIGGNSLNFATQCVKRKIEKVSVLGAIGNDRYGTLIKNHLMKLGIDNTHLYVIDGDTATNKIYINDAGDRFFKTDSWNGGVYQLFRLSNEDWEFVYSHDVMTIPCLDPNFNEVLSKKQPLIKLVVDFLDIHDLDFIVKALPVIDIGFVSGDKALVEALKPVARQLNTLIVITLGAAGSVAIEGDQEYYQPAIPVKNVVDTTGCGDAYQAAFVVSYFENRNIKEAMEKGSYAASQVLGHMGSVE